MSVYEYVARDKWGNLRKGIFEAETTLSLVRKLRGEGLFITSVAEVPEKPKRKSKRRVNNINIFKPVVKPKELMVFTRQFAAMLDSGVDITECLNILEERNDNPTLKDIISQVKTDIEEGNDLAEALSKHPKVFNRLYIGMVQAAQATGSYGPVLSNIAHEIEKGENIKRQIKSTLMMPLMTFVFAIVLSFSLIKFVVPKFLVLYKNTGNLPKPTQMLIALSNSVQGMQGLIFIISVILFIIAFKLFVGSKNGGFIWDKIKLKAPIVGPIFQKIAIANFSRVLRLLLMSGVGYLESLDIVSQAANNRVLENVLREAKNGLTTGKRLSIPLARSGLFPLLVIQMINTGERSNRLPEMLNGVVNIYEEEVDRSTETIKTAIVPIMTLFMGIIVGGLLLGLYLPIFSLGKMLMMSH
jgi:type IV pilus assembly protein PilC